ncbi:MAG: MBL fold metallo-hydrolase [Acidobacteria bacterium]|nr:MBL fold metallo-hydrolase [Acidobacteriota bacterium]
MRLLLCLAAIAVSAVLVSAQGRTKTLDIYVVDVEGGNATLFVTPLGESLLIDTGNGGAAAARDARRILDAARNAGIARIDHLITTHYHGDHVGGLEALAAQIPIRHFIDHGPNVQPNAAIDTFLQKTYPELYRRGPHTVAKAGDRIPIAGIDVRVVASAAAATATPLPGAGGRNPYCATFKPHTVNPVSGQPVGNTEDEQSVGTYVTFGSFRALYLGDLPWNQEFELMCPTNRIGTVDLFVVSRHGQPSSNSEALVHAIRPRVAVINNGTRKGGQPDAMRILYSSPGLEDVWQIHFSLLGGQEYTVPGLFIANGVDDQPAAMPIPPMPLPPPGPNAPPPPAHNGPAYWIKVSAQEDGTFTVTNARNGFSKVYRRELSGTR